jgi:DNA-binding MarR family transcriptional regulator
MLYFRYMDITPRQFSENILLTLYHIKHSIADFAEYHNLTPVQLLMLYRLSEHHQIAMGKVADVLHCDPSNVTGIVDRLVTQGLITRQEWPQDRRTKNIQLTNEGQAKLDALLGGLPQAMGYQKLSTREQAQLYQLLQKLCS